MIVLCIVLDKRVPVLTKVLHRNMLTQCMFLPLIPAKSPDRNDDDDDGQEQAPSSQPCAESIP